jgi:hypothetical protein
LVEVALLHLCITQRSNSMQEKEWDLQNKCKNFQSLHLTHLAILASYLLYLILEAMNTQNKDTLNSEISFYKCDPSTNLVSILAVRFDTKLSHLAARVHSDFSRLVAMDVI